MGKLKELWGNSFFLVLVVVFGIIFTFFAFAIFSVMGSIFFNAYNQLTQGFIR
ncbi:MAG: hypothetical protein QNL04_06185 [SAR324 cluster bacterium]|nr:hypothetical protein [SAR324 cluster bacterium]